MSRSDSRPVSFPPNTWDYNLRPEFFNMNVVNPGIPPDAPFVTSETEYSPAPFDVGMASHHEFSVYSPHPTFFNTNVVGPGIPPDVSYQDLGPPSPFNASMAYYPNMYQLPETLNFPPMHTSNETEVEFGQLSEDLPSGSSSGIMINNYNPMYHQLIDRSSPILHCSSDENALSPQINNNDCCWTNNTENYLDHDPIPKEDELKKQLKDLQEAYRNLQMEFYRVVVKLDNEINERDIRNQTLYINNCNTQEPQF